LIHSDGIGGDRESHFRKMLAMKPVSGLLILQKKSFPGLLVKVQKNSRHVGIDLAYSFQHFTTILPYISNRDRILEIQD
jgi:hypothetical protein